MTHKFRRYRRFWAVFAGVLALDQLTKYAVLAEIPATGREHSGIVVAEGFFRLVHVYNEGAAWSLFAGNQGALILLALVAFVLLFRFRRTLAVEQPMNQLALGAFAGGALGNVADRIVHSHVIDFLAFHLPVVNYDWPAFNVADIGITTGAAVFCLRGFFEKSAPSKPAPETDAC